MTGRPQRPAIAAVAAPGFGLAELEKLPGPGLARWRCGLAHPARSRHDLGRDLGVAAREPSPTPVDGGAGTPSVGGSRLPWNPWGTHGPALRRLVDLAVPESSFVVQPPGDFGGTRRPHARGLLQR